jgi:hypothetical protein|tara:strand:- start:418 stop:777 length:360 start_codon:yes stop_codon:yes gene_type:complete
MAISYTWDVSTVDTYPSHSDGSNTKSDVIYNVHWRLKAVDDTNKDADGNNHTAETYGSQSLDVSDHTGFKAFASVKQSDVQAWVEAAIGSTEVASMKSGLDAQITEKITPTSVVKTISS